MKYKSLFFLGIVLFSRHLTGQIFAPEIKVQSMLNNNVGIGTDSPTGKLSIFSSGTIGEGNFENAYLFITNGVEELGLDPNQLYSNQDFNFAAQHFMKFYTGSAVRLTILNDGKVGIGTEVPIGKLSILSSGTIGDGSFANSYLYIANGTEKLGLDPNQLYSNQDFNFAAQHFMKFYTGSAVRLTILNDGKVGIGTESPNYNLEVTGSIKGETLHTNSNNWSDFVFAEGYNLLTPKEVERFINKNGHLPDIPSEAEVKMTGINVAEMDKMLLQKIEELTLYIIEQNKAIEELQKKYDRLESKLH